MEPRGIFAFLKAFGGASLGCGSEFIGRSGENAASTTDLRYSSGKTTYLESKKEGFSKIIGSDAYAGNLTVFLEAGRGAEVFQNILQKYGGVKLQDPNSKFPWLLQGKQWTAPRQLERLFSELSC